MSYIRSLGRGRHNAEEPKTQQAHVGSENKMTDSEKRFQDAAAKHAAAVQRFIPSEKITDHKTVDEALDTPQEAILERVVSTYCDGKGDDGSQTLQKTREFFNNMMSDDSNVCLVCLESITRSEPIWSCSSCYVSLHLACIQQWINEGAYRNTKLSQKHFPDRKQPWHCPKCRMDYSPDVKPSKYKCFCGARSDPNDDQWIVPHSCGETCRRKLLPECGHTCLLLCHPGPCAPCPKYITLSCHCGSEPAARRRCSDKYWSCGKPCGRLLSCQQHECQAVCHPGGCKPCNSTSVQSCLCGKSSKSVPCTQTQWTCNKRCEKKLNCGRHKCEKVCHSAEECGVCPKAAKFRTCPCGKSTAEDLPCSREVPCCGDSCLKTLACGVHDCAEKCHIGPCPKCKELTVKSCRCGAKRKEMLCCKEFINCDTKCTKIKTCGRHQCKRKCCDGFSCPPCDQRCNRQLNCGNHQCASVCHDGPCYPCNVSVKKSCACGSTSISVPCIRGKSARKPRCRLPCAKTPLCDHKAIQKHQCHFGECPPCALTCGRGFPRCEHQCQLQCHDVVTVTRRTNNPAASGPWEKVEEVYTETIRKPCDPCPVPEAVTCLGMHETVERPCHDSKPRSCGRRCGRKLDCGNHTCGRECHTITEGPKHKNAGRNCSPCQSICKRKRPSGCFHKCLLPCHPDPCPPCDETVRSKCHCGRSTVHMSCFESNDDKQNKLTKLCCGGPCLKQLPCGHTCMERCHSGRCNPRCSEELNLKCPCMKHEEVHPCGQVTAGHVLVKCGSECQDRRDRAASSETEVTGSDADILDESLLPVRKRKSRRRRDEPRTDTVTPLISPKLLKKLAIGAAVLAVIVFLVLAASSDN